MTAKYEQELVKDYIITYTGKRFYVADPRPEDICVEDIAHALSQLVRYTGHTRTKFYSVGEHSMLCSILAYKLEMSARIQLIALLHDASEAYCNDINRPLKQRLPEYKVAEDKISETVWEALDVHPTAEEYEVIKRLDNTLLMFEMKQIMLAKEDEFPNVEYYEDVDPFNLSPELSMQEVKRGFLAVYKELLDEYEQEKNN